MNNEQLNHFRAKLEEEKKLVEGELAGVAARNSSNPSDWTPVSHPQASDNADENVAADSFEELENNTGIAHTLEKRLTDITDALAKIENGNYGTCEVSGEMIEEDRLEANPAARTCKAHM